MSEVPLYEPHHSTASREYYLLGRWGPREVGISYERGTPVNPNAHTRSPARARSPSAHSMTPNGESGGMRRDANLESSDSNRCTQHFKSKPFLFFQPPFETSSSNYLSSSSNHHSRAFSSNHHSRAQSMTPNGESGGMRRDANLESSDSIRCAGGWMLWVSASSASGQVGSATPQTLSPKP